MSRRQYFLFFVFTVALAAQDLDLRVYSEFQRIDAAGEVIHADQGETSQEIVSPAVVRNGYTTFHIAVTARPRVLYWFAIQTNPAGIFRIRLYKEQSVQHVPDSLSEQRTPLYFLGVMPDAAAAMVTEVYLLDIWTPANTSIDRVRVEVLAKTGYWTVVPMEVRLLPFSVPDLSMPAGCCSVLPPARKPASASVWEPVFRALTDAPIPRVAAAGTVRSVIRRNATQDAAIIRSLDRATRGRLFDQFWPVMAATVLPLPVAIRPRAESYLPLRRMIYSAAGEKSAGAGK